MNTPVYLLCHRDSEICQSTVDSLPSDYHTHFAIHWVEDDHPPHDTVHPHLIKTLSEKKEHYTENPQAYKTPSVLFYDENRKEYIRHDGRHALQFVHQFTQHRHHHKMMHLHRDTTDHFPHLKRSATNIEKILHMSNNHPATEQEKKESLQDIIKHTAKGKLQEIYMKLHKDHKPLPSVNKK